MALWRIRATVDDRPGYLSVLTASLALRSVNILAVQVHTTEDGAVDDFLVDAPDTMSELELQTAIARGRGRDAFVTRAEAQGLADQPTRALALAGRLVHDPDALGEALVALLDAAEVRWRPAGTVVLHGYDEQHMTLIDPAGGSGRQRTSPASSRETSASPSASGSRASRPASASARVGWSARPSASARVTNASRPRPRAIAACRSASVSASGASMRKSSTAPASVVCTWTARMFTDRRARLAVRTER